jgi:KaiC/GvpD/RAD55 family RecA-like ATPase
MEADSMSRSSKQERQRRRAIVRASTLAGGVAMEARDVAIADEIASGAIHWDDEGGDASEPATREDDAPPIDEYADELASVRAPRELRPDGIDRRGEVEPPPGATAERSGAQSRAPSSIREVLARWKIDGPLEHEPTGFAALDDLTGGGFVYGSRIYVNGAPNAGKTLLVVQLIHELAERGIAVGLLASDEEPDDIVTRFVQRAGFSRRAAEARVHDEIDAMDRRIGDLPLRIYDGGDWTIDAAAEDFASYARSIGARGAFAIDSLHTVVCEHERAADRELPEVQAIKARTVAIRRAAIGHKLIAIVTSEMNRSGYGTRKAREDSSPLARGKGSGSIEYAARVLIDVSSIAGEGNVVRVEVPKNKDGGGQASLESEGNALYLEIDRAGQCLVPSHYSTPGPADASEREAARESARAAVSGRRVMDDAAKLAVMLAASPGLISRDVRAHGQVAGVPKTRIDPAVAALGAACVTVPGARGAQLHYLDGAALPDAVLKLVQGADRARVIAARPPAAQPPDAPSSETFEAAE